MSLAAKSVGPNSGPGLTATGIFLSFSSLMTFLAGTTLVWKGTPLARVWLLNPTANGHLTPFGELASILFLILG